MSAEAVQYRQGFAPAQRLAVAQLYWQAFGGKLGRVLGPEDRALDYLTRVIRSDHCVSAFDDQGQLLGVAGFKTLRGSFAGGSSYDMRAVYGLWGAYWRGLVLMMLSNSVDNERFLVDGIAVQDFAQGQGIGTRLLENLYQEGRMRGYGEIRLEVVDRNPRARALYERLGFCLIAEERLGILAPIFGFRSAYVMTRIL